jgi:hypothetical protein
MSARPSPMPARAPANAGLSARQRYRPPATLAGHPFPGITGDRRLLAAIFGLILVRDLRGMKRSRRSFRQIHLFICRTFTGATGLEPATSGVTGRSWRLRVERGYAGICGGSMAFRPCGDGRHLRERPVISCGMCAGWDVVFTQEPVAITPAQVTWRASGRGSPAIPRRAFAG